MLRLSKLADYSILMMNDIVTSPALLSATDIATHLRLPEPTVSKLLKILTKKSILQSTRGAKGGYQLAMPAEQINLVDIISAIDGDIALTECDQQQGQCSVQSHCAVSHNWRRIGTAIRDGLRKISLADMKQPIPEHTIQFHLTKKP